MTDLVSYRCAIMARGFGLRSIIIMILAMGCTGCCSYNYGEPASDLSRFDIPGHHASPALSHHYPARLAVAWVGPAASREERRHTSDHLHDPGAMKLIEMSENLTKYWATQLAKLDQVNGAILLDPKRDSFDGTHQNLLLLAKNRGADLLLVYSLENTHSEPDFLGTPVLSILTLGLLPNVIENADATVCMRLIDTHTGYVYAVDEQDRHAWHLANLYTMDDASDIAYDRAGKKVVEKLARQFHTHWAKVLTDHRPISGNAIQTTSTVYRETVMEVSTTSPMPVGQRYQTE